MMVVVEQEDDDVMMMVVLEHPFLGHVLISRLKTIIS